MKTRRLGVLLWLLSAGAAAAPLLECLPAPRIPIMVRIGNPAGAVTPAFLEGGAAPPLRVVDARTGALLWSAGPAAPVLQPFPAMHADFAGSLAVLDTDADGLHDRIYAGDLAGRIWRFDLHHGATADHWASGGVFADFSNTEGRGFVAPPDISLAAPAGAPPWLNIAVGTATPDGGRANNRYYVLRDYAVFDSWNDARYRALAPLRESDLLHVDNQPAADAPIRSGWFVELGAGAVLTPSLTVAGRAVLAITESGASPATGCRVVVSVSAIRLDAATPAFDLDGNGVIDARDWRIALPTPLPAATPFALTQTAADSMACALGGIAVPACDVDTRPVKTWWRREDAD